MAQLIYKIGIQWQNVYSEIKRMSSYEGRFAVTPSGDSNYPNVHVTGQDEPLILQYIMLGTYDVEEKLDSLVTEVTSTGYTMTDTTQFTFTLDSARTSYKELTKMLTEAIASYAMMQWVSERKHERYDFFSNLYQQMISGIQKSLTRKRKPSLDITY